MNGHIHISGGPIHGVSDPCRIGHFFWDTKFMLIALGVLSRPDSNSSAWGDKLPHADWEWELRRCTCYMVEQLAV